jgi:hypothetical protein
MDQAGTTHSGQEDLPQTPRLELDLAMPPGPMNRNHLQAKEAKHGH